MLAIKGHESHLIGPQGLVESGPLPVTIVIVLESFLSLKIDTEIIGINLLIRKIISTDHCTAHSGMTLISHHLTRKLNIHMLA